MAQKATTKKMARKKTEFAKKIRAVREAHPAMNKAQFAEALGVTHPLVSQCESGKKTPSTDLLVRLGNVAAAKDLHADAMWFWRNAGVSLERLVPVALDMLEAVGPSTPHGVVTGIKPSSAVLPSGQEGKGREQSELLYVDTRTLRNPYYSKYVLASNLILVVDEEDSELWSLIDSYVAVVQHPASVREALEASSELIGTELAKYPMFAMQSITQTALYSGWLRARKHGDDLVVSLESQTPFGTTSSQVVGVQVGTGARTRKAVVPYFTVLGRIVQWIDMRGKLLTPQREKSDRYDKEKKHK